MPALSLVIGRGGGSLSVLKIWQRPDPPQVAPPARVELQFSDIVQLKSLTIQQGSAKPRPLPGVPEKWADTFALPVEALPAGSYVLRWSAATEDGHQAEGQIRFTVQDAAHQHQHP